MEYPYRIPLNKTRLYTLASICTFLFLAGLPVLLKGGDNFVDGIRPFIMLAFAINALLFGSGAFVLFRQARQKEDGLIIDTQGIHDKTTRQHRHINWGEVDDIRSVEISRSSFIMIDVNDPERFIARAAGSLMQKGLRSNLKQYGTPVAIATSNLKMDHEKIMALLTEEFKNYRALPNDLRLKLLDPLSRDIEKLDR